MGLEMQRVPMKKPVPKGYKEPQTLKASDTPYPVKVFSDSSVYLDTGAGYRKVGLPVKKKL